MFKYFFDYTVILICFFLIINSLQSEVFYHKRVVEYVCAKSEYLKNDVTKKENKQKVGWGLSKNKLVEFYKGKQDNSFLIVFTSAFFCLPFNQVPAKFAIGVMNCKAISSPYLINSVSK